MAAVFEVRAELRAARSDVTGSLAPSSPLTLDRARGFRSSIVSSAALALGYVATFDMRCEGRMQRGRVLARQRSPRGSKGFEPSGSRP